MKVWVSMPVLSGPKFEGRASYGPVRAGIARNETRGLASSVMEDATVKRTRWASGRQQREPIPVPLPHHAMPNESSMSSGSSFRNIRPGREIQDDHGPTTSKVQRFLCLAYR